MLRVDCTLNAQSHEIAKLIKLTLQSISECIMYYVKHGIAFIGHRDAVSNRGSLVLY